MNYKRAIQRVIKKLNKDKDMRRAWRDNISMAIQDGLKEKKTAPGKIEYSEIKEIADDAAEKFLDNLTKERR